LIQVIERIYKVFLCTEQEKVRYAAYMFRSLALEWWEIECRIHLDLENELEWEQFKKVFLGKYFPSSIQLKKAWEFQ
jgi:hypothetical protein